MFGFGVAVSADIRAADSAPQWIAGDHHIHSRYSTGWDREQEPPAPILGGDAIYPIQMNALMAKYFGLGKIGRDQVEDYAERIGESREATERRLAPNLAYNRT